MGLELDEDITKHYDTRMRLGYTYQLLGDWDLAATQFEVASTLLPQIAEPWAAAGDAWYEGGNFSFAITHYRQALRIDPSRNDVQLALTQAFFHKELRRP